MLYPRYVKTENGTELIHEDQMVGWYEHMLLRHRMIFFDSLIGMGNTAKALSGSMETGMLNTLMALDSISHDPIKMVITSMGGDMNIVFLLYDVIKMIRSPVEMLGRICVSGAALLLAAGSKRYLSPHAKVMLHLPSGAMEGDVKEWEIRHAEMQKYKERMVDMLQECGVKADRETILQDVDRDFWLEPSEAISYGLADTVMTSEHWSQWIKGEK